LAMRCIGTVDDRGRPFWAVAYRDRWRYGALLVEAAWARSSGRRHDSVPVGRPSEERCEPPPLDTKTPPTTSGATPMPIELSLGFVAASALLAHHPRADDPHRHQLLRVAWAAREISAGRGGRFGRLDCARRITSGAGRSLGHVSILVHGRQVGGWS